MTTAELEKQLLKLPVRDKLRIIGLLLKNLTSLWSASAEPAQPLQNDQSQSSQTNLQQSWPELVNSLAGTWSNFPGAIELCAEGCTNPSQPNPAQQWPEAVLNYEGIPDFPALESYRDELLPPREPELSSYASEAERS